MSMMNDDVITYINGLCEWNLPVDSPHKEPVTWNFDNFNVSTEFYSELKMFILWEISEYVIQ